MTCKCYAHAISYSSCSASVMYLYVQLRKVAGLDKWQSLNCAQVTSNFGLEPAYLVFPKSSGYK